MDFSIDTLIQAGLGGAAIVMLRQFKNEVKKGFRGVHAILAGHGRMLMAHQAALEELTNEAPALVIGFQPQAEEAADDPDVGDDPEEDDDVVETHKLPD